MQNTIDQTQRTLLRLLGACLFGAEPPQLSAETLPALWRESAQQAVTVLALQHAALPGADGARIRSAILRRLSANAEIFSQHTLVHELMGQANVPYVILKGAASAYYYPDPLFRTMGDVDFLVAPEDVDRASEYLKSQGFAPWREKHVCHIVFTRDAIHLELHFAPAGVPYGKAGELVRGYLADILATASTVETDVCTFRNPDRFHHGLVMLLHMQHHLLSEGIGLRHLCDWAVFVNAFGDGAFSALFEPRLRAAGLWRFAQTMSLAAHLGLSLPYQPFMGEDTALAEAILADILAGGNFGNKDAERFTQGIFISDRGKDGVKRSRLAQFVATANSVAGTHWKPAREHKLLLPVGWALYGAKRIARTLRGEREPLHLFSAYQTCQDRKELYQQLRLFETE